MTNGPRHGAPAATNDAARGGRLPRRRWTPGDFPFRLELAPAGLVLGLDAQGMSATFPLIVPTHSTRVGIVAELGVAQLLALRLLDQSCDLTVVTHRRDEWEGVAAAVPHTPVAISHQLRRWPLEDTPPPWALVIDMDDPPPTGFTRAPWSTVVHLAPTVPHGSGWWQSAHLVLTTGAHARDVLVLRPRLDASALDRLTADDIVAVDQDGLHVVRPSLSQREYSLLSNPGRP